MAKDKKGKDLIAYCGLYCGECPGHQGIIAYLSRDLRKELRKAKVEKIAETLATASPFKEFKYYKETYDLLGALVKFRCKRVCKNGGGPPFCKIRKCCQKKDIDGCWRCELFTTCEKLDFLKSGHGDAHIKNLRILKRKGEKEFLQGKKHWYSAIKQ
ncbi:MAG: DUF3795 domain-containing protein [Candidatus Aminicenantes bacterium]|nr:MAG: DUF3795 domain-containing protein [Candidatus Aminicenantes bacterium]